jgi:hypothetical protein
LKRWLIWPWVMTPVWEVHYRLYVSGVSLQVGSDHVQ